MLYSRNFFHLVPKYIPFQERERERKSNRSTLFVHEKIYPSSTRIPIVPFIPGRTSLPHPRQPLPITIQIGRRLFSRLKRINIQPGRVQKHGFHFAQSRATRALFGQWNRSGSDKSLSRLYYAIISLKRVRAGE